ncbi:sine oculis-binding protein homolog B-like [Carassius gibelio]|uniref:sine oculis-binding protein homolog B-like n=1 Tax=Carassius gibelio TaxID=101364 RepID=UPI002278EFDE|nr:sine oculis-binding protein homolog B-like [Carassius gibelio]
MAPVYLACRLQFSCFLLFLSDVSFTCCMRLVYAHQALLDIRISVGVSLANFHSVDVECPFHKPYKPPRTIFLHNICRWPLNAKRGSRGGYMMKLRAYLQADISFGHRSLAWHPRDAVYRCLRPVLPLHLSHATQVDLRSVGRRARQNRVNHGNLRSLRKAPSSHVSIPPPKLALINARSVVCDWCKHMRHTKEYLDFGSGEERLQFCSNKCLNQYKMDVFYREARAALSSSGSTHKDEEDRPKTAVAENQKLLTPEAWDRPEKTLSPRSPPQQTPVSAPQPRIQTRVSPSSPARPSHVTPEQPRPPQMPLPFVRPPLQGLRSPASHPPRPLSPIQRASFAPPPLLQPFPAPYMPFHPAYPPPLPPPWPQPMMLSPYPVFVPIPVPIPIPIPVFPQTGHTGVIRKLQEQEEERTPDPGHSEEPNSTVKTERCASPLTSERQVIQCLHKHPVKDETHTRESPTHKALYTSVVMPTASRIVTPASLYSLARSTAIQAASFSLDSSSPSPLSDGEDVKNSCLGGRDDGSTNHWSEEQMDCLIDQSKESQKEEEAPQDVEHTYARSIPPKLREKNTQTHLHTQTQTREKNTDLGSEASGRDDPEPAVKRRCLRIRDQIK